MLSKKDLLLLLLLSFLLLLAANVGKINIFGENYPDKPISLIVPYTPGGSADLLARILEKPAYQQFGQSLVITNIPGGGGIRGWNELADATPDGYTLGITAMAVILQPLFGETRYHYATALDPIAQLVSFPMMAVVHADQPWQNIGDLINYAKAHPGEIKFGHSGLGGSPHITGELFAKDSGVDIIQVPFRGDSEALAALLGGHVQLIFVSPPTLKEHIKAGNIKVLAVAGAERLNDPVFAGVPTFKEQGVKLESALWYGVGAPKQLPPVVKQRLVAGFKAIADDPEFRKNAANIGFTLDYLDAKQSTVKWIEQNERLLKLVNETGLAEKVKAQKN